MQTRREQLVIDPQKCNGCRLCEIACAMRHQGTCDPDFARIAVLQFKKPDLNQPLVCMACDDAPCIKVCPLNARHRKPNGTVVTEAERCIACRACIYICPIGSPRIDPASGKTITCDMCLGEETLPWCVSACRDQGALQVKDPQVSAGETMRSQADRLKASHGCKS